MIRWKVKLDFKMKHMTDVGVKGIDLYHKYNGSWCYLLSGIPSGKNNEVYLKGLSNHMREYRLHLPLYDTVTSLEIGIDDTSSFDIINANGLPIVFYGTSITQGGCASRPGIAHTNAISRELGQECINLGFSGNGHMEVSVGSIISKIEAKLIVIECMANVDLSTVRKNTIPLIEAIRDVQLDRFPGLVFIEEAIVNDGIPNRKVIESIHEKNLELREQIKNAKNMGHENLHVISQLGLINKDTEGTVDGTHYNDLGFERHTSHFIGSVKEIGIF